LDQQRFDSLTRALATGSSRRTGLRLLAGAGAAVFAFVRGEVPGTSARAQFLTAGDPCYDSSQCRAADAPLICADNGFDYDGPLNCCTYEGSRCFADEGCCGTAVCVNGFCASSSNYPDIGGQCRNGSDCISGDSPRYCDYVAATDDYRCCTTEGYWCGSNADCCGWLICDSNTCISEPAPSPYCTGEGCDCYQGTYDPDPCDQGLVCCLYSDTNGTCMPLFSCTGTGAPGDDCPRYCLPGPTQCPSCVSGYCTAAGVCG
jgi:hypothetical protein